MAVWAAAAAPVLLGGAALSVDVSRLYNMDHELQSAADALARASAAELDQRSDSLERSARALSNLVTNHQKFGQGGKASVRIASVRYLTELPEKDYQDVPHSFVTTEPSKARFVEVNVAPETVSTMFPQGLVKSVSSVTLAAKSTAGFSQDVCGVAPVFICNPFENSDTTIYEAMETPAFRRQQIKLKTQGKNASHSPGNFGYLDPFQGNSGASKIKDAIAIDKPPVCMSKSAGVKLRPGNINSMAHAVNTRFDLYEGTFKGKRSDPAYAPAANVVKGYTATKNNVCKMTPNNAAIGMPRDTCFENENCSASNGRMGNGNWDFVEYMKVNHNYMPAITIEGVTYRLDYNQHKFYPSTPPSRYALYRWEIDNYCVPGALTYGTSSKTPEEGLPQCHATGPHSDPDIDRRIIHVAVLNCGAIESSGEPMNGRTGPVPVETFVKVFLTEPMAKGSDNTLWGEVVGPVVNGEDEVARDRVALSR
jgi:Flp pilus assembly protein TadG